MCIVGGTCLFIGLLMSRARWALPCFITMWAASALLVDRLLRTTPRASIALISLTLILSAAMVSLRPARKLLGNIRDGDLSRAYSYQMPKLFDDLPEGTVVLNAGNHTWKYPLLGARLKNRVIDAGERGLHPPFSQSQLDAEAVEVVFFRGRHPSVFTDDVAFEKIFDNREDPNRLRTTNPTRVFRVLRSESSRYQQESPQHRERSKVPDQADQRNARSALDVDDAGSSG